MTSANGILVTGAPRSGTSWVGRMVSQAPHVRYVHEPFNITSRPCHCGVKFDYWFQYVSSNNKRLFHDHLGHTIFPGFSRIGLLNQVTWMWQSKRIRPLAGYFRSYLSHRVVVKDPLAVISAETVADLFDMDVVVVVRHPAAVVSSYKQLHWSHPFSHFLQQPQLMEEHFAPYRAEIEDVARHRYGVVDEAALLWKLIHSVVVTYRERRPSWVVVRYEDLASNPIEGFRNMFERVRLPFSHRASDVIRAHSPSGYGPDTPSPYAIKRDSHHVMSKWKNDLTVTEVDRIRARVQDVASVFFTDEDWVI
jgi:hypothetical protein